MNPLLGLGDWPVASSHFSNFTDTKKLLGGGQGWWDWPGSLDFFSGCIKTGTHVSLYVPSA